MNTFFVIFFKFSFFMFSLIPVIIIFFIQLWKFNYCTLYHALFFLGIYLFFFLVDYVIVKSKLRWSKIPIKIVNCRKSSVDMLVYFATYVIPFAFVWDLSSTRTVISLILLIFTLWLISCTTNVYISNPILLIFGWKTYNVEIDNKWWNISCFALSRKKIPYNKIVEEKWLFIEADELVLILK